MEGLPVRAKRITFNAHSHGLAIGLGASGNVKSIHADDRHSLTIDEERRVVVVSAGAHHYWVPFEALTMIEVERPQAVQPEAKPTVRKAEKGLAS